MAAPEDRKQGEIFREVEPEDLLKYGLIPEFVGRLPVVATLEDLDEPSLKRILTEPKNALVKQYQRMFEMETVDLTLADEALSAIARKAIDRKTGARGLRSIMESILLDTMFDLPSLEGVEEVVISREVVEGSARPLYIYADRSDRAERCRRSERLTGAGTPHPRFGARPTLPPSQRAVLREKSGFLDRVAVRAPPIVCERKERTRNRVTKPGRVSYPPQGTEMVLAKWAHLSSLLRCGEDGV